MYKSEFHGNNNNNNINNTNNNNNNNIMDWENSEQH